MGEAVAAVDTSESLFAPKELESLVRSIGKDAFLFLLEEKYEIKEELSKTISDLALIIENHKNRDEMIGILVEVKECCSSVHEETFLEFCEKYGITGIVFNESLKISALRCYLQQPEHFATIKMFSAINKEKQFDVYGGKTTDEEVNLKKEHRTEIKSVLEDLIEKGRKCIISTTQIQNEIIMSAHFESRKKTFTTISSGEKIETVTITPTVKAVAKYNIKENRLRVKGGPSSKLKDSIIQTFGKVFFGDNSHFTGENYEIYKLDKVKKDDFSLTLDEELEEEVISAVIKEEILIVPIEDDTIRLTVAGKDVEKALEFLSNDKINLKTQQREQVKIEITLKQPNDKTKKIAVTISNNSKINFNPQYSGIVHKCLTKWGIELGTE
ncbi:hypothetical protein E2K98_12690 [Bacillus salipaludis]|uniref:Uncharacterized protein n=1 Tax=Bacillus salipaludis TaxID=2547811 RepID=A0A4R5VTF3_9BACI|nr:hypothetical protein [Bacillus salipaludis]TDK61740.1 hypothetical protein E2K98_12690 [Bacillus salipaludis]